MIQIREFHSSSTGATEYAVEAANRFMEEIGDNFVDVKFTETYDNYNMESEWDFKVFVIYKKEKQIK